MLAALLKKRRRSGTAGISVEPDGVAVARVLHDGEIPRLQSCAFYPSANGSDQAKIVERAVREHDLHALHCVSVIDSESYNLLLVEAPEVDPTELKAAVRWRIKDLIDFHIDDAVIDVFDIPAQRGGRARMMYVVVARAGRVRRHIDLLESGKLNLQVIDIPDLALRNIAAMVPEDATGVALLQIGRHGGTLTITRNGDLFLARSLDIGIAQLAAEATRLAEPLANAVGMELEREDEGAVAPGLQRLFDGIVLEVQRSLDYYESHFSLPPVSALVIAPLERPVPNLLAHLAGNLGIPVREMDLNALLDIDQPLSDASQARCLLAIGAALRHEEKSL